MLIRCSFIGLWRQIFQILKRSWIKTSPWESMTLLRSNPWNHCATITIGLLKSFCFIRYLIIQSPNRTFYKDFFSFQKKGTATVNKDFSERCSRSLLQHILNKCYNKSVVDPNLLNHYEAFTPEVSFFENCILMKLTFHQLSFFSGLWRN